jgi:hypothetical protein
MAVSVDHAAPARAVARRALNQADALLGDLEELQLRGDTDVPTWCGDSATALRWASIKAGLRDPRLESESGVIKLMDDVYTLEERLMRRLRLRTGQRPGALVSA